LAKLGWNMHELSRIFVLGTLLCACQGAPAWDTLTPDELGISNDELIVARDSWQPFKNKYGWQIVNVCDLY
jgi:hypothetical protein